MKVLVADRLEPAAVERLRAAGHEVVERTGLAGEPLAAALGGCAAIVIRSATRVTAEVLAAARARGVTVRNTPSANAVSVAELTLGLLLAFERHLPWAAGDLRQGRWEKTKYAGRELAGRTLGLLGFGRIGREVARRARAFEMEVRAHDPLLERWPEDFGWVGRDSFEDLLASVDYLSLHLPLDSGTRHRVDAAALARMKPDAVLVNVARGGVVDEEALHDALVAGKLRGAILDVFEREPPGENPLMALPQVLATPHLGASTREAQVRAGLEAADLVIAELARPV